MAFTKLSRVQAVLKGEPPDYPPFSCWHHFPPGSFCGQAGVDAHLRHIEAVDVDFVKVMNDNEYPRVPPGAVIESAADLRSLHEHGPAVEEFSRQLDLIRRLGERLGGQLLMVTTVFNAWATLRRLCGPPSDEHGPPKLNGGRDVRDERFTALLREDRSAVAGALDTISRSLASFAKACVQAGAGGIFLSVRDDWADTQENGTDTYDEMVRSTDLRILEGASAGEFNLLHVCGCPKNFNRFGRYPAHAINWADRCGPPTIAAAREMTELPLSGGLNNLGTLVDGTPEQCAAEARDAAAQAGDRRLLVTPGCTYDPARVSLDNLRAARDALRNG